MPNLLNCCTSASEQCGIVRATDWMINHHERIVRIAKDTSHQFSSADELCGHDSGCRDPLPLGYDGVMQTARRTTASIADAADDRIPLPHLCHDLRAGRRAVIRFGTPNHVFDAEFRAQQIV